VSVYQPAIVQCPVPVQLTELTTDRWNEFVPAFSGGFSAEAAHLPDATVIYMPTWCPVVLT
jgi:hypothetical protein